MKSKVAANLDAMPTVSPDGMVELERHEQVMLGMQSSLSLATSMDIA